MTASSTSSILDRRPRRCRTGPPSLRTAHPDAPLGIEAITRRDLLRGGGALGVGWILAACGTDREPTGVPPPTATERAFPVTIEHENGGTTLDEVPERIVTLTVQWVDAALAMDVQPLAYLVDDSFGAGLFPWHGDLLEGSMAIQGGGGEVPFEQIAQLEPDLILDTFLSLERAVLDRLSSLAPTTGLLVGREIDRWLVIAPDLLARPLVALGNSSNHPDAGRAAPSAPAW